MKLRGGARASSAPNVRYHVCGLACHQELGPLRGNLHHFAAVAKMMWLSGVGASALLRCPPRGRRRTRWGTRSPGSSCARRGGAVRLDSVRGVTETLFLMQDIVSGKRAGQLCDFGGRREESDEDAFATAARELCEETDGGSAAGGGGERLRHEWASARGPLRVHPGGKYATFFPASPPPPPPSRRSTPLRPSPSRCAPSGGCAPANSSRARRRTVLPRLAPRTPASSAAPTRRPPPSTAPSSRRSPSSAGRHRPRRQRGGAPAAVDRRAPARPPLGAHARAGGRPAAAAPKAPAWDQNELVLRGFAATLEPLIPSHCHNVHLPHLPYSR